MARKIACARQEGHFWVIQWTLVSRFTIPLRDHARKAAADKDYKKQRTYPKDVSSRFWTIGSKQRVQKTMRPWLLCIRIYRRLWLRNVWMSSALHAKIKLKGLQPQFRFILPTSQIYGNYQQNRLPSKGGVSVESLESTRKYNQRRGEKTHRYQQH